MECAKKVIWNKCKLHQYVKASERTKNSSRYYKVNTVNGSIKAIEDLINYDAS